MKMSGRVLAANLLVVAAVGYAEIASAGPHGGAGGFHAMSSARFGNTGVGTMRGVQRNGIIGTGVEQKGIIGTGAERNGIAETKNAN